MGRIAQVTINSEQIELLFAGKSVVVNVPPDVNQLIIRQESLLAELSRIFKKYKKKGPFGT